MTSSGACSDMEVLSMDASPDWESEFRIRVGTDVKYVLIQPNAYDFDDVLSFPPALLETLAPLPPGEWTRMTIDPDEANYVQSNVFSDPLPGVSTIWHPNMVDVLSLQKIRSFKSRTAEVLYDGQPAVAKIARFSYEIPFVEKETKVYATLARKGLCGEPTPGPESEPEQETRTRGDIAPRFLGHLTGNGRVMGMLLERVEGRPASINDLAACEKVVGRLHALGFAHGDLNRYNFIVDDVSGRVCLVDFENASPVSDGAATDELAALPELLSEETGRGGPPVPF